MIIVNGLNQQQKKLYQKNNHQTVIHTKNTKNCVTIKQKGFLWLSLVNNKYYNTNYNLVLKGEGVGTSNFRTTTGHFFQNVEMVFLVDQNIEIQKDQNIKVTYLCRFAFLT